MSKEICTVFLIEKKNRKQDPWADYPKQNPSQFIYNKSRLMWPLVSVIILGLSLTESDYINRIIKKIGRFLSSNQK